MPESVSSVIEGMDEHIKRTVELLEKTDLEAVSALVDKLYEAYREGSRVFICGNGGSAATASHFSQDLAKSTIKDHTVQKRHGVSAVQWAAENGVFTAGCSGFNGGKLKGMVDLSVHSPVLDMEIAENTHMVVVHLVVSGLRAKISEAA